MLEFLLNLHIYRKKPNPFFYSILLHLLIPYQYYIYSLHSTYREHIFIYTIYFSNQLGDTIYTLSTFSFLYHMIYHIYGIYVIY